MQSESIKQSPPFSTAPVRAAVAVGASEGAADGAVLGAYVPATKSLRAWTRGRELEKNERNEHFATRSSGVPESSVHADGPVNDEWGWEKLGASPLGSAGGGQLHLRVGGSVGLAALKLL